MTPLNRFAVANYCKPRVRVDAHGWIKHVGRECPVQPDAFVQVRYRAGYLSETGPANWWDLCWWLDDETDCDFDIIAYRIIQQPQP